MPENLASKLDRFKFNLFPAYRGTGARVEYISADYHEIRIKIPLNWRTRNYVGTIFGGSMYAGIDPIYMIMLMKILGRDYVVWDKAAMIRFKRPGKETLYAQFLVTHEDIEEIKTALGSKRHINKIYKVELKNKEGKTHAIIEKTLYIAKKINKSENKSVHNNKINMTIDYTNYGFIFDMDGTLVDNMHFHTKAWVAMLAENGIENDGQDFLVKTAGKTNREIIPQYFENASEDELLRLGNRKEEIYRKLFKPKLKAVDGVIEFLGESKKLGVKMAVATAAPIANMEFILDGLDLRKYFSVITTAADVQNGKPHPEGFLISAKKLGVEPKNCLVFEDALNGFEAAYNAGMKSVGIATVNSIETILSLPLVIEACVDFSNLTPQDLVSKYVPKQARAN